MAKNIPKGQINKTQFNLKPLQDLIKNCSEKYSIKVGIIGEQATEIHEGTNLTNAELGAVHEFGASINHPGGQPYFINSKTGLAQFLKKDSFFGQLQTKRGMVTKPHQINIPARSFLRETLLTSKGKKELYAEAEKLLERTFKGELSKDPFVNQYQYGNQFTGDVMYKLAVSMGATAQQMVKAKFYDEGITPPTKPASKKMRLAVGGNPAASTLVSTGQLKDSISYEVKKSK